MLALTTKCQLVKESLRCITFEVLHPYATVFFYLFAVYQDILSAYSFDYASII